MLFILKGIVRGVARNVTPPRCRAAFTRSTVTDTVARFKTSSSSLFSKTLASTLASTYAFLFAAVNDGDLQRCSLRVRLKFRNFDKDIPKLPRIINKNKMKLIAKFDIGFPRDNVAKDATINS